MLANSTPRTVLTPFGTFPSSSFRRRNAAAWNPRNSSLIKNTMQTHCQIVCFHTKHEATFVVYFIWSNVYCSVFRSTSVTPTGEDHIRVWASDWRSTWDCTKKTRRVLKCPPITLSLSAILIVFSGGGLSVLKMWFPAFYPFVFDSCPLVFPSFPFSVHSYPFMFPSCPFIFPSCPFISSHFAFVSFQFPFHVAFTFLSLCIPAFLFPFIWAKPG